MARYILIEVDDNGVANELVEDFGKAENLFYMGKDGHFKNIDPQAVRVKGLFAKPTQFCSCPDDGKEVTGENLGWWIHRGCGKPRPGHCQHPRNLLDPREMHPRNRDFYLGVYEPNLPDHKR